MESARLVLKPTTTRGAVEFMALDFDWSVHTVSVHTVNEGSRTTTFYKVWIEGPDDDQSAIIYTEDEVVEVRYLSVHGDLEIAERIRATVDVYTEDELTHALATASRHDEVVRAIMVFGVSRVPAFDANAFQAFQRHLEHTDPRVRLGTIAAMGFPAWSQFIDALRPLSESDVDKRVRSRATRMIGLLGHARAAAAKESEA